MRDLLDPDEHVWVFGSPRSTPQHRARRFVVSVPVLGYTA
jgi:hypothetical protein